MAEVNTKTGEAECQFYRRSLVYMEDSQRLSEILLSRFLYCHGELKSHKGQVVNQYSVLFICLDHNFICDCLNFLLCLFTQRLHVFLFELALVVARPGEVREVGQVFHVYRQPLLNTSINLEEIPDGDLGGGSTFRGAFTGGNDKGKGNNTAQKIN